MAAARVTVVGSCIMDFLLSVPRLPRIGETVIASDLRVAPGGKGANQAVFLARLGAAVQLLSCIGDDDHGRAFRAKLTAEGVGCDHLAVDRQAPTGLGVPMIAAGDANAIVVAPGAAMRLSVETVRAAASSIAASRAVLAQLEVPAAAIREAAAIAVAAGVPFFLNAAPAVDGAAELCRLADVLIVNEEEASLLSGVAVGDDLESAGAAAAALQLLGPQVVVVTLGRRGALFVEQRGAALHRVPAFAVAAVDPTGAGDAFCAGLVSARAAGTDWLAAVETANACGALATTAIGAMQARFDKAAVEQLVCHGVRHPA